MGTFSRKDERALAIGCGCVLLVAAALVTGLAYSIYEILKAVF